MNNHCSDSKKPGFSIIELMVVIVIVILAVSIGMVTTSSQRRYNDLQNQCRYTKAVFRQARADALENSAPILVQVNYADNTILVLRDQNLDGSFEDDPEVVIGQDFETGIGSPYDATVEMDPARGPTDLPIWMQEDVFAGRMAEDFTSDAFIVMPNGRILDSDTLDPNGGTFFYKSRDDQYFGAVHITAMGEAKYAIMRDGEQGTGDFNGWLWK